MEKEQLKLLCVLLMNQIYADIRKIVREEIEIAFKKNKDQFPSAQIMPTLAILYPKKARAKPLLPALAWKAVTPRYVTVTAKVSFCEPLN